ncbi:hypothetical protein HT664_09590, partial [Ursidibacter maritimus]
LQHQTVQALASVATQSEQLTAEQGVLTGESALTPIQQWFFDTDMPQRGHWNQCVLLQPAEPLEPALLERALLALVMHHDALRLSFEQRNGQWQAQYLGAASQPLLWQASVADLQDCAGLFNDAQRSLDLHAGPLLRAVLV